MSLISLSNFIEPFRQRFHLITIILIVVVFATLRLSGAAIEVRNLADTRRSPVSPVDPAKRLPTQLTFPSSNSSAPATNVTRPEDARTEELMAALRARNAAQQAQRTESLKLSPNSQGYMIEDVMRPAAPPVAQNKADDGSRNTNDASNGSLSDIEKQLGLK